jgi:hypothetical protein
VIFSKYSAKKRPVSKMVQTQREKYERRVSSNEAKLLAAMGTLDYIKLAR